MIDEYKEIHKPNAPKGISLTLESGDMLVYSGCELEHWREAFEGNVCVQAFLHYNDAKSKNPNLWDGRPHPGLPNKFCFPINIRPSMDVKNFAILRAFPNACITGTSRFPILINLLPLNCSSGEFGIAFTL